MLRNDVIIRAAIVEGEIDLHKQLSFVWKKTCLSGYCQVSSRSTAMAFYDAQSFPRGFPRKHSNTSRIRKSYSGRSRAHLAASTE